jgi:predicted transcriptional regulator
MSPEPDSEASEVIRLVVKRAELLDRLDETPATKRDLRDDLGVSRSTVYKAVRELESANLTEETEDGPRLTLAGRLVADRYRSFAGAVGDVVSHAPILDAIPHDAPMTTAVLDGGDHVLAERHAPNRPLAHVEEVVQGADDVVGFSPVVLPQYVDLFHEQLVSGELTAELVVESPVAEHRRIDHADRVGEALAAGRLVLWETDASLPSGLVVGGDDGLALIVYEESGELRGLFGNDTSAAREWGRAVFEAFRDDASEVEFE